jgi:hypothetical protein
LSRSLRGSFLALISVITFFGTASSNTRIIEKAKNLEKYEKEIRAKWGEDVI